MPEFSKFSVVIPYFKAENYIAVAIRSEVVQECQSLEIVLAENGSSDGSDELVRDWFPHIEFAIQVS